MNKDKVIFAISRGLYTDKQLKEFTREQLEDMVRKDSYLNNGDIVKICPNGYNSAIEYLISEGFDDTDWDIIKFGF